MHNSKKTWSNHSFLWFQRLLRRMILFLICLAGVCLVTFTAQGAVEIDEKTIALPGLSREYDFAVVNDMHILVKDDDILSDMTETYDARYELFRSQEGSPSSKEWEEIVDSVNELSPDGVILNGDILDFYSPANWECFKAGYQRLEAPVLYARADHDLGIWYHDTVTGQERMAAQKELDGYARIMYWEYPEFLVVGINNNTSQMTRTMLRKFKKLYQKQKPMILFQHVPIQSQIDDGLGEMSKMYQDNRVLLWGDRGCYYEPGDYTRQFLELVLAKSSPVAAVLGAHLYFSYEDLLNERIIQYVFDASFKGKIGLVHVVPE